MTDLFMKFPQLILLTKIVKFFVLVISILVSSVLVPATMVQAQEWKLEKEEGGIRIYTGAESSSSLLSYKAEAEVETSLAKLFSFLQDTQLAKDWLYDLNSIKTLEQKVGFETYYYAIYSTPWPILDVSSVLKASWQYDEKSKLLTNITHSVSAEEYSRAGFYEEDGFMHVPLIATHNRFQQLADNKVKLTFEIKIDHGYLIPNLIVDAVSIDTLIKTLQNLKAVDYSSYNDADLAALLAYQKELARQGS